MNPVDFSGVDQARAAAQSATQNAQNYAIGGPNLADELRKAVGERFNSSPLAQQTAQAQSDFLAAGPQARADVAGLVNSGSILSPTQQQSILAAKRSAALVPLTAAGIMNNAEFGTMQDLINAGIGGYNAEAQRQSGLAQLASQNYSNLLNELTTKVQLTKASQPDTQVVEANGRKLLINSQTGQVIQDLGSSTAGSQNLPSVNLNGAVNGYINEQGQVWTDKTKVPVATLADGSTLYSDGSTGWTKWLPF